MYVLRRRLRNSVGVFKTKMHLYPNYGRLCDQLVGGSSGSRYELGSGSGTILRSTDTNLLH